MIKYFVAIIELLSQTNHFYIVSSAYKATFTWNNMCALASGINCLHTC